MSDAKTPPDLSMDEILATIRRIIAGDEASVRGASEGPTAPAAAAGDVEAVLELTEVIDENGVVRPPHDPLSGAAAGRVSPLAAAPAQTTPEPIAPLRAAPDARLDPGPAKAVDQRVIADAASFAASLRGGTTLRREPRLDSAPALDSRKLEEIVGEMLWPLLRSWLDDNLPLLIERLVQAEIARVVRNPGPI
jgi:cell pole-organizing protein PopZ